MANENWKYTQNKLKRFKTKEYHKIPLDRFASNKTLLHSLNDIHKWQIVFYMEFLKGIVAQ